MFLVQLSVSEYDRCFKRSLFIRFFCLMGRCKHLFEHAHWEEMPKIVDWVILARERFSCIAKNDRREFDSLFMFFFISFSSSSWNLILRTTARQLGASQWLTEIIKSFLEWFSFGGTTQRADFINMCLQFIMRSINALSVIYEKEFLCWRFIDIRLNSTNINFVNKYFDVVQAWMKCSNFLRRKRNVIWYLNNHVFLIKIHRIDLYMEVKLQFNV